MSDAEEELLLGETNGASKKALNLDTNEIEEKVKRMQDLLEKAALYTAKKETGDDSTLLSPSKAQTTMSAVE
nr:unnamed protein product [Spirometra erinaceieuropaei]